MTDVIASRPFATLPTTRFVNPSTTSTGLHQDVALATERERVWAERKVKYIMSKEVYEV